MNEKQRRRCEIITRLIANKISNSEANELLGRSNRQVRRIQQRYEAQSLETLVQAFRVDRLYGARSQTSSSN